MSIIKVKKLCKDYKYNVKDDKKGFLYNLFNSNEKIVKAVNNISFEVEEGETIAFIGPNGAGKSTTIKMLTGILYPTSGDIKICGLTPIKDRDKLAYKIGTVFGQRSQLLPNLPLTDSMEMFGAMYDMSKEEIESRIEELSELFDLKEFIKQPVRKLSLGQRMRAEIATSLIHRPKIIFLDEPTIGLDVISKKKLRDLFLRINQEEKTTIFLTSHDTEDIQSICKRCVIINHGKIIIDTTTKDLMSSYIKNKNIKSGCVFVTKTGKPMSRWNIWREMKNICVEAGVNPQNVFPHNLRHLFARTFYGIEKDIAKLADILGHSSIDTTRIYIVTTSAEHLKKMQSMRLIL